MRRGGRGVVSGGRAQGPEGLTGPDTDRQGTDSSQNVGRSSDLRNDPGFFLLDASRKGEKPVIELQIERIIADCADQTSGRFDPLRAFFSLKRHSGRYDERATKHPEAVSQRNPGSLRDSLDLPSLSLESVPCPSVSGPVRPSRHFWFPSLFRAFRESVKHKKRRPA